MSGSELGLAVSVFLACTVEAVEALTIVLAVGVTRSWRSALAGVAAALVVLGGLLLIFGLQWLRKAILRAAGLKAIHDEAAIFQREQAAARDAGARREGNDPYAFTVAFKGTLLEGLEVVFIVLTFGANQHDVGLAAVAAAAAVVLVVVAGAVVHAPLARVPENTLKFLVGVMLTSFGTFWGTEGAGAHWPGGDASLLGLIPTVALLALGLVVVARRAATRAGTIGVSQAVSP
jgi:uncharacterized membrane protein